MSTPHHQRLAPARFVAVVDLHGEMGEGPRFRIDFGKRQLRLTPTRRLSIRLRERRRRPPRRERLPTLRDPAGSLLVGVVPVLLTAPPDEGSAPTDETPPSRAARPPTAGAPSSPL